MKFHFLSNNLYKDIVCDFISSLYFLINGMGHPTWLETKSYWQSMLCFFPLFFSAAEESKLFFFFCFHFWNLILRSHAQGIPKIFTPSSQNPMRFFPISLAESVHAAVAVLRRVPEPVRIVALNLLRRRQVHLEKRRRDGRDV